MVVEEPVRHRKFERSEAQILNSGGGALDAAIRPSAADNICPLYA